MTVTYTSEVTTSRGISIFFKLLARWRGSIYKIVWVDLIMFLGFYYILNLAYRFAFDDYSKKVFEKIVWYCDRYAGLIPLSFVLGFYVNLVMTRWWNQYTSIPFPDNLGILVGASIKGQNERARIVRRTIMRYVCLTFTITLTMISPKVKKRFPTYDHFIDAGLLTKDEKIIIDDLDSEFPSYSKYWLPLAWAANIVTRARHEGLIRDDDTVKVLLEEINHFRTKCGSMLDYDWISVPLVYTQVVTLAVYSYFITAAIGKQYVKPANGDIDIDLYFPFLPVLEFFFYMGWLKVAETLINPYGEDDDDFEVVWMIDRHVQVSYLLVDRIHEEHPKLMRDQHWFQTAPNSLPFTVASQNYMQEYPFPSTLNVTVKKADQDIVPEAECQPDGHTGRRSGAYLWRLYGKNLRHRPSAVSKDYPLQKVRYPSTNGVLETDEINNYDDSVKVQTLSHDSSRSHLEDFENLKLKRQQERRNKLLKYFELTKSSSSESHDLLNIIDDIVK